MIYCTHMVFVGSFDTKECGKRARWEVTKIKQNCAGHVIAMQVCGIHKRFWEGRGFRTKLIASETKRKK
jgi:hypothetical protein